MGTGPPGPRGTIENILTDLLAARVAKCLFDRKLSFITARTSDMDMDEWAYGDLAGSQLKLVPNIFGYLKILA
ncbi:hypothetical protein [Oryza sativa Japonica Group]|uniref:Uncharacterized protein n=1 Tax=Oryza sativa subsp. japonica TaxID=39947 RepID=Q5N839_ORYSJ|nr:hypothetical protein [Oryza sativa Japonica Group]